jgi:hypothetical protein
MPGTTLITEDAWMNETQLLSLSTLTLDLVRGRESNAHIYAVISELCMLDQ